jgi:hypothetical protein
MILHTGANQMSGNTRKHMIFVVLAVLLLLPVFEVFSFSAVKAQGTSGSDLVLWANDGGDKVTQDELRATRNPSAVLNSVWDGRGISLFGGQNEVVSFDLVLEAPGSAVTGLNVEASSLVGPDGNSISTRPASGNDVFNFVGRNIELFYVKYLKIQGLSIAAYEGYYYDERHIPERFRRPYNVSTGEASGTWTDRPDHDKYYPDIAVPLELNSPFDISAGKSQCIWGDVYIPKTVSPGSYTGTITVQKNGASYREVPITLSVRNFVLPDVPSAKTMMFVDQENIGDRFLGNMYPDPGTEAYNELISVENLYFQLAHRHKISLFDNPIPVSQMGEAWVSRLNGELFTPANGYGGVGEGVGNNIYVIGAYGGWPWEGTGKSDIWKNSNAWVDLFSSQSFATPTEYLLYLIDESTDYPQIQQWAQWMDSNPGSGSGLKSFATISLPAAEANTPSLDIPCSVAQIGFTDTWNNALDTLRRKSDGEFFMYNSQRPVSGSFATEDDGVALRALAWGQYKLGIDRWFYWDGDYYDNYQGYRGQTNVFQEAQTFGQRSDTPDVERGQTGNNYYNGDGVLFYPGKDTRFPQGSYGVMGPFASIRLKEWRRGIQDVDYLTLANKVNPVLTAQIVNRVVPKFMWEYGADNDSNPSTDEYFLRSDASWSKDPDVWEEARRELAAIIEGTKYEPSSTPTTPSSAVPFPSSTSTAQPPFHLEYIAVPAVLIAVPVIVFLVFALLKKRRLRGTRD